MFAIESMIVLLLITEWMADLSHYFDKDGGEYVWIK